MRAKFKKPHLSVIIRKVNGHLGTITIMDFGTESAQIPHWNLLVFHTEIHMKSMWKASNIIDFFQSSMQKILRGFRTE